MLYAVGVNIKFIVSIWGNSALIIGIFDDELLLVCNSKPILPDLYNNLVQFKTSFPLHLGQLQGTLIAFRWVLVKYGWFVLPEIFEINLFLGIFKFFSKIR